MFLWYLKHRYPLWTLTALQHTEPPYNDLQSLLRLSYMTKMFAKWWNVFLLYQKHHSKSSLGTLCWSSFATAHLMVHISSIFKTSCELNGAFGILPSLQKWWFRWLLRWYFTLWTGYQGSNMATGWFFSFATREEEEKEDLYFSHSGGTTKKYHGIKNLFTHRS